MPTFLLDTEAIGNTLRYAWITLVALALMFIVLLVLPPLVPFVTEYVVSPSASAFVASNRVEMKAWLDFSIISLEVAIAVCIGGAAFSEGLANRIRGQLRDWQTAYAQTGEETVEEGVSNTVQVANHVKRLHGKLQQFDFEKTPFGNTVEFYLKMMEEADLVTGDIEDLLLRHYPKIIRTMVTTSLISSFPGGIYGMIAFTLFWCLMVAKVTYIYISGVV
jgi:hypothetical protein